MSVSASFRARKQKQSTNDADDRSKKGSIDAPIEDLIREMNTHAMLCTTSSCSGRTALFVEDVEKHGKKGGLWIYVSHTIPEIAKVLSAVHEFLQDSEKRRLTFCFEPFIMACECGTLDVAKNLVQMGRVAGFRESGIVLGKDKINVTIRTSSRLEIPLCEGNMMLVPDTYIQHITSVAMDKFDRNAEKIRAFTSLFRSAFISQNGMHHESPSDMEVSVGLPPQKLSTFRTWDSYVSKLEWQLIPLEDSKLDKELARWGHSACVVSECVLIFGGYGGSNSHQRLNDALLYNLSTCNLSSIQLKGETPSPRMGHVSVSIGSRVYIIGGRTHPGNPLADVYKLETTTWACARMDTSLPPRFRHSVCLHESSVFVFGGSGTTGPMNDLWVMDVDQKETFSLIETFGQCPSPRMSHGACVKGEWLFVHGGFSDYGHIHCDLFKLCLKTFIWEEVVIPGLRLPGCFSHSLVTLSADVIALFGGCQGEPERMLLLDPDARHGRLLQTETESDQTWMPIRQVAVVLKERLFVFGGGAFCFSFGSVFSLSFSMDLRSLVSTFSSGIGRRCDIDGPIRSGEIHPGIVVPKRDAKKVKNALKALKWLDAQYKSTVMESGNRIAFPLVQTQIETVHELSLAPSVEEWLSEGPLDLGSVLLLHEMLRRKTAVPQELEFVSQDAGSLPPAARLRRMLKTLLQEKQIPGQEALLGEIPEKWEKLGDLVLLPADSLISPIWEERCGQSLWNSVSQALDCQRIARQSPISKAETRDSRVSLLYGTDGWVHHIENGISFRLDVTKCMFSSGNVSERIRMAQISCRGETVVDLYAGIGYYTVPLLAKACAQKVVACDWNRNAVKALRINLRENGVEQRCQVLEGDCRKQARVGVADRVILGLLPTSEGGWKTALASLKPTGGWLHLHENSKDSEEKQRMKSILNSLTDLCKELHLEWDIRLKHCERVKWYAPHIRHIVLDILCQPLSTANSPTADELGNTSPQSRVHQTTDADALLARTCDVSMDRFWNEIIPSRNPALIQDLDLGVASKCWNAEYLISHSEALSTLVSAHVFVDDKGLMNFVHKNFEFHTMSFSDLVRRCSAPQELPPIVAPGERYYLRSIGKNPRKERSWFHESFPFLAQDLKLPSFMDPDRLFSTVLRVSSPHVRLWTHFDVMDNLLIQITGTKTVKLWPPSEDPYLYVSGSSSKVVDVDNPDLEKYPEFSHAQGFEIMLRPGEVLYIPALWFHNVHSQDFSVAVNVFFHHLPKEFYDRKDLYGNRDPPIVQEASKQIDAIRQSLSSLAPDFRSFYTQRLLRQLKTDPLSTPPE